LQKGCYCIITEKYCNYEIVMIGETSSTCLQQAWRKQDDQSGVLHVTLKKEVITHEKTF